MKILKYFWKKKGEIFYLSNSIYDTFNKKFNSLSKAEKYKLTHIKDRFFADDFIYVYNIYHDFTKDKKDYYGEKRS